MSYVVTVTITCDAPNCTNSITKAYTNSGGLNKTFAGYIASAAGWSMAGAGTTHANPKVAFCPTHAEEK